MVLGINIIKMSIQAPSHQALIFTNPFAAILHVCSLCLNLLNKDKFLKSKSKHGVRIYTNITISKHG